MKKTRIMKKQLNKFIKLSISCIDVYIYYRGYNPIMKTHT